MSRRELTSAPFAAAAWLAILCAGCTADTPCVAGSTQICVGAGRCEGVQICEDDGQRFGPCDCEGGPDGGLADAQVADAEVPDADRPDGGARRHIALDTLKAFPSAFGAGRDLTGGRGGEIYEVTNLNDSGPGSLREAVLARGPRVIIIKVEGRIDARSPLYAGAEENGDCTIWGQLAPGRGLTWSGDRFEFRNNTNVIIRHLSSQTRDPAHAGTWDSLIIDEPAEGGGFYLEHNSFRYGMDEAFGVYSKYASNRSTIAYNLGAESIEGHNTGIILGNSAALYPSGDFTFARNMFYNISHRFPNVGAGNEAVFEVYENYIVNWQQRLTRSNGPVRIDYFHNYAQKGNHGFGSAHPVNKWVYRSDWTSMRIFSDFNFVSEWAETPSANQQNIWVYRNDVPELGAMQGDPLPSSYFVTERQGDYDLPPAGLWDTMDVPVNVMASVGHNRGVDADGSPGFFRDDLDARYVERASTGTTEADYRTSAEWTDSTFTGTALYADGDGDHMPDWFEAQHAHLDPAVPDGADTHVDWDFGDFTVSNDAGYTNLEICAEYYAGGFEAMR